ncbi:MAG: fasciclin domain-containing protein [bacterium]|nr:fasciclin domain-containing protein [bacterium]
MRRIMLVVAAVLLLAVMAVPVAAQGTIVDVAASNPDFSTLVAAVQAADPAILETLSGEGPFTVFAPTNEAFNNLLTSLNLTADDLLANTELLTTVLLYHVVAGEFGSEAVVGLDGQIVPTLLEDANIGVSIVDGTVVLNDTVEVIQTDIAASNGIIHVINDVLLPQVVIEQLGLQAEATEEPTEEIVPGVSIRVAHFSPDTPNVDVYVNGEAAITDLAFGSVTDFITLPAGSYEIAVAPAGTSIEEAAIGPATFDLPEGTFITVAAVGSLEAGTLTAAIFTRDFSELPADTARVVVFHAIEDAPAVDILANGSPLISELAFPGSFTDASGNPNDGAFEIDVPAGTYDLAVVPSGATEPVVIDLPGTELVAGTYYLVAATGTLEAPAPVVIAVDAETAAALREANLNVNAMMEPEATEEAMMPMGTIVDIAAAEPTFSTLVAAVQAADPAILEALSGEGPLTVFAPTDDAFAALLEELGLTAEELLGNTELLTTVLLYHVVDGAVLAEDVIALDGQEVATLQGESVSIAVVDGGVMLNGSVNVTQTDIVATNGVIHVIDAVLLPPSVVEALGQ